MTTITNIPPGNLHIDTERCQVRVEMSPEAIERYAQSITDGQRLPACRVIRIDDLLVLAEGHHRFHAHKQARSKVIPCIVEDGTWADVVMCAIRENTRHGVQLTTEDRHRGAVLHWTETEHTGNRLTDQELAAELGVSRSSVQRWHAAYREATNAGPVVEVDPDERAAEILGTPDDWETPAPEEPDTPPNPEQQRLTELMHRVEQANTQVREIMMSLRTIRKTLKTLIADDPMFGPISEVRQEIDRNLAFVIKAITGRAPERVCLQCDGDVEGCDRCAQRGWMTHDEAKVYEQDQKQAGSETA